MASVHYFRRTLLFRTFPNYSCKYLASRAQNDLNTKYIHSKMVLENIVSIIIYANEVPITVKKDVQFIPFLEALDVSFERVFEFR